MKCSNCGTFLPDSASSCTNCGMVFPQQENKGRKKQKKVITPPDKWIVIDAILGIGIVLMLILLFVMNRTGATKTEANAKEQGTESITNESSFVEGKSLEDFSMVGQAPEATAPTAEDVENTGEYLLPDSETQEVTEENLQDMSPQELTYARNEIYARHGKVFQSEELNTYFQSKDWYEANETFDEGSLTAMETQNADFILNYQNNNDKEYTPQ